MSNFKSQQTPIAGLHVIQRRPKGDERGYFERLFCASDLEPFIGNRGILQINQTLTGMHFQHPPYAEMKLVSCLRGKVFDVAVDVRQGSPTFLQWHGEILSEENHSTLCIPEGFAHGFQTLTEDCKLIYLHTADYAPDAEAGLNALDPRLAISWPMPVAERSLRDQHHAMLTSHFSGLSV